MTAAPALPDGVSVEDWTGKPDEMPYRAIWTPTQTVSGYVNLSLTAFQRADGRIEVGDQAVFLETATDDHRMSLDQVRELVAALTEVIDTADKWGQWHDE